jgi:RNA polymerase-associated protein CTR9
MKTSLDYSRRALEIAPEQIHFKFNIAFVQMQLAQLIYGLPDHQRSLVEVEAAAEGLDQAIDSFVEIAQAKNPPYPRHDLEQRANMGRNTIRKQLERAVQSQRDYEEANASKLAEARRRREEDLKRKEEEKQRAEEELAAQKRRLQEERQKLLDRSRELAAKREEEERLKEDAEWTDNTEGERVKRKARKKAAAGKRKKKGEDESDVERSGAGSDSSAPPVRRKKRTEGEEAPRKKRKLARGKTEKTNSKFKSSEMIDDSDVSDDAAPAKTQDDSELSDVASVRGTPDVDTVMADGDDEEEEEVAVVRPRKKVARLIEDDDEEEEEEAEEEGSKATVNRRADAAGEESE